MYFYTRTRKKAIGGTRGTDRGTVKNLEPPGPSGAEAGEGQVVEKAKADDGQEDTGFNSVSFRTKDGLN